ncbi:Protein transport protein SEC22 [Trametes pubescens]|uniref:Protein transport protein SEC22 n=1 Tax=Trametes pubescens TaxID=154538 RepID=A0A1M2VSM3_TRAPU|nr:Protein transport protein SEC22 [Trametes pubescens]
MVKSTLVVRASDALPLAASVDDEQTEQALSEHKQQAKLIFRRIGANSEPRCSIESGQHTLQCVLLALHSHPVALISVSLFASYLIADNVIYLVITDKSYPRKLAFSYLDEVSKEFQVSYGAKVDTVRKPYAFVGFDTFMSKTTRLYQDTRTASAAGASHMDQLNGELQDVTRIMTKNMEELLWRGDSLDRMSHLSTSLRSESEKYRKAARNINFQAMLRQYAPIGGVLFILIILIWWRFS